MKLVDNAKDGWKWVSTWCFAAEIALLTTWEKLPNVFKESFSEGWVLTLGVVIAVVGILGRFIDQGRKA